MSPGESGGNGWMESGGYENRGGVGGADMAREGVEEGFSRISQAMVRFVFSVGGYGFGGMVAVEGEICG